MTPKEEIADFIRAEPATPDGRRSLVERQVGELRAEFKEAKHAPIIEQIRELLELLAAEAIHGAVAATEGGDSASAAGLVEWRVVAATTEEADRALFQGLVTDHGTLEQQIAAYIDMAYGPQGPPEPVRREDLRAEIEKALNETFCLNTLDRGRKIAKDRSRSS